LGVGELGFHFRGQRGSSLLISAMLPTLPAWNLLRLS